MNPEYFEEKTFDQIFKAIDSLQNTVKEQGESTQKALAEQSRAIGSVENKISLIYGYASGVSIVASLLIAWIKNKIGSSS